MKLDSLHGHKPGSKIAATALGISILVAGVGALSYSTKSANSATTVAPKPNHALVHRTALAKLLVPITFDTSGTVAVGLPNGPGVLSVTFRGRLLGRDHGNLALFASGVPQPTGTLGLNRSRFELRLSNTTTFFGHVTSFDSTAISIVARSSVGGLYRGVIQTNVNAVTNTFTAKLTLHPVRGLAPVASPNSKSPLLSSSAASGTSL